jgi:hypothetical protein
VGAQAELFRLIGVRNCVNVQCRELLPIWPLPAHRCLLAVWIACPLRCCVQIPPAEDDPLAKHVLDPSPAVLEVSGAGHERCPPPGDWRAGPPTSAVAKPYSVLTRLLQNLGECGPTCDHATHAVCPLMTLLQGSAPQRARLEQLFPVKETGQPATLQLSAAGAAPPASIPLASLPAGAQEEGEPGWVEEGVWGTTVACTQHQQACLLVDRVCWFNSVLVLLAHQGNLTSDSCFVAISRALTQSKCPHGHISPPPPSGQCWRRHPC